MAGAPQPRLQEWSPRRHGERLNISISMLVLEDAAAALRPALAATPGWGEVRGQAGGSTGSVTAWV